MWESIKVYQRKSKHAESRSRCLFQTVACLNPQPDTAAQENLPGRANSRARDRPQMVGAHWRPQRIESTRINAPARFTVSAPSDTSLTKYDVEARSGFPRSPHPASSIDRRRSEAARPLPLGCVGPDQYIDRPTQARAWVCQDRPTEAVCARWSRSGWSIINRMRSLTLPSLPNSIPNTGTKAIAVGAVERKQHPPREATSTAFGSDGVGALIDPCKTASTGRPERRQDKGRP